MGIRIVEHASKSHHQSVRPHLQYGLHRFLLPPSAVDAREIPHRAHLHRIGHLHRHVSSPSRSHYAGRRYHYFRIFNSFTEAYTPCLRDDATGAVNYNICDADKYGYQPTGLAFNDAYRYVDWLLTVPLLLIEIVLVMGLPTQETTSRCTYLGVSAILMIAFGYPGESSSEHSTRWIFWCISMVPFSFIVYTLFIGLKQAQEDQPAAVRGLVKMACYATVVSWCTYPIVYLFPVLGDSSDGTGGLSATATTAVQVGYTVSDVISKCGVGYLVYLIGYAKSQLLHGEKDDEVQHSRLHQTAEEC